MDDDWNDGMDDADLARILDNPQANGDCNSTNGLRTEEQHAGFDNNVGDSWIYPSNLPMRVYQKKIIQSALYRNTLVVLPTGLGKTFIAAVVMYNLYRWYPKGKVIFMAPTRPLVAQQIEACQRIMPFPNEDTVEMTGKLPRPKRCELWRSKRVFFVTPQVLQSDIASATVDDEFPFKQVKLLVFDEAHKAKGRYAYTEVAQSMIDHNPYFRVLALSATPGRTTEDVGEVIRNLFISHVEVRYDHSIDVVPYVHKRAMRTVVVPLGEQIRGIREELLTIIDPYVRQLIEAEVLGGSLANMNRNFLLYEQRRFRERSMHQRHSDASAVSTNFSICISLYHALELLERHGLRVFLNSFEADDEGRCKFVLAVDRRLAELVERLRNEMGANPFDVSAHAMTNGRMPEMPADLDFGHPKFEEARQCLIKHFEAKPDSRAIVFCEYRESVMLIYRLLLQHSPLLRPRCFVGQGGTTGSLRALTQKQQIQIMADFRTGKSNILIATSIGEEGIDVGEVELIVCFDISTSNPTRFVQRIGRTGRQKNGNVVMLVTEGREQQLLHEVLKNKDQTNKKLTNSTVIRGALYGHSPRLVPTELNPVCLHTFIEPAEGREPEATPPPKETRKKSSKEKSLSRAVKGSQDLRKFFKASQSIQAPLAVEKPLPLDDENEVTIVSDSSQPAIVEDREEEAVPVDPKHLKKINRILGGKTSLVPRPERNEDLLTQLRSPLLEQEAKLLLLRLRVDFVRDICDQMKMLLALPTGDDDDVIVMTKEEQHIRETYHLLETICGGRDELDALLEDCEYAAYKRAIPLDDADDTDAAATNALNMSDAAFMSCVDAIFAKCDNFGFRCDNFDYIQGELQKTTRYQQLFEEPELSLMEETVNYTFEEDEELADDTTTEYSLMDSKYASQWEEFVREGGDSRENKSTPLHGGAIAKALKRQQERGNVKSSTFLENLMQDDDDIYFIEEEPAAIAETAKFECSKTTTNAALNDDDDVYFTEDLALMETQKFEPPLKASNHSECLNASTRSEVLSLSASPRGGAAMSRITSMLKTLGEALSPARNMPQREKCPNKVPSESTESFESLPKDESGHTNGIPVREQTPPRAPSPSHDHKHSKSAEKILSELDLDMDAFLEPFPEEALHSHETEKENRQQCPAITVNSPDLFACDDSPRSPRKTTLASKLAAKKLASAMKTPPKLQTPAATEANKKSPSIFDMYMKNLRRRAELPKSPLAERSKNNTTAHADLSVIVGPRRVSSKRKLIDSSDDDDCVRPKREESVVVVSEPEVDTDLEEEEIAATQGVKQSSNRFHSASQANQAQKRRRLANSFIEQEAGVSGTESEDEAEHTIGQYLCDSVVVADSGDDSVDSAASATDLHAIYLQSIRSPQKHRGAFKMPAPRQYDDIATIYSQAPPIEDSQYLVDSFVVHEADSSRGDVSMCPLERAEKILKERRRAKRQYGQVGTIQSRKRRRIVRMGDSSDDEDNH